MRVFDSARKQTRAHIPDHQIAVIRTSAPIVQIAERGGVTFNARLSRPATGDYWAICPFHAEGTPSFHVVERDGERYFRCHGCGAKGDALELAQRLLGCSFRQAIEACGGFVEVWPSSEAGERARHEQEAHAAAARTSKIEAAKRIYYAAGGHVIGTAGEHYLRVARAITGPLDHAELRFHPSCPLNPYAPDNGDRCPAMVAPIRLADGSHIGTHCTFLKPDGSGKADFPHLKGARMSVGIVGGGFIRLGAITDAALIGEGIESALSASETFGLPPLAAISAGNMAKLTLPRAIRRVVIALDRDKSGVGEKAANELAERLWLGGVRVELAQPPQGFKDWNDHAQAHAGDVHDR